MTDMSGRPAETGGQRAERTRTVPLYEPLADIFETGDALVLAVEMPGVDVDAMTISVENRVLTIRGSGQDLVPEGYALFHGEYRVGDYERAFTLPSAIDANRIEATARNGVLMLTLPKVQPAPAKTISVKSA
jgi:HSP20 family protein